MKRILRNTIMLAAAVAAAACAKEIAEVPSSEGKLPEGEGITFTAGFADNSAPSGQDTKVAIDIDETSGKAKLSFTAGDFVSVYDGKTVDRITLKAENINPDGTATFKANVSADAETYYAYVSDRNTLGSYEPAIVYTNVKNTHNPNEFAEIAAGRTPHAAYASCGKDGRLSFRNMLTLLKFKVSTSGVSYVEFKGNKDEYVIGKIRGKYGTGEVSLITFNVEQNLSKTAKSYVSAAGADCFLALAPAVNYAAGFTITAYDASGNVVFATKRDKAFATTAGKIWDLGTLEDHKMTPYELWQAGYDLEIGGKMYNKAEYGEGKLIAEGKSESLNDAGGVYFIEKGANVDISSAYKGSVLLVGNDGSSKGNVTVLHGGDFAPADGEELSHHVIAFKNVNITNQDKSRRIINGAPNLNRIVLDGCDIKANVVFINRQNNSQLLEDMTIVDCNIQVLDDVSMIQFWDGTGYSLGSITIKNNVVWSANEHNMFFFADAIHGNGGAFTDVVIENNTFYNVDNGNKDIWFGRVMVTASDISGSISIKNNLAFSTSPKTKNDDSQRFFGLCKVKTGTYESVKSKAQYSDNWSDYPQMMILGGQGGSETTTFVKGYDYDYTNNILRSFVNPFESFDLTTGEFKMAAGYEKYGAQR